MEKYKNQLWRIPLIVVSAIVAFVALIYVAGDIIAGLVKILMAWLGVELAAIFMVCLVFTFVGGLFYILKIRSQD